MSKQKNGPDPSASPIDGADAPIRSLSEDRLGRQSFAEALAAEVMAAPAARGYVMGLTGPWGSGKTSILNMTVDALGDDAIVVEFNPWMFSGTEALVNSFFAEIGKQLAKKEAKLKAVGGKLATYGQLLSPLAASSARAVQFRAQPIFSRRCRRHRRCTSSTRSYATCSKGSTSVSSSSSMTSTASAPPRCSTSSASFASSATFPTRCISSPSIAAVSKNASERETPRGDARTSKRSSRSPMTCRRHGSRTSPRCSSRASRRCSMPFP